MKKFIPKNKSFRIVIFFIAILCLSFGGYTVCKLIFNTNPGSYWDGTVSSSFHSGNGTQANPYTVTTAAEFAHIQSACNNGIYIRIDNDIYLNEGYIEYQDEEYKISIGNNTYSLNPGTGEYFNGTTKAGELIPLGTSEDKLSCHIDGNNHKIFGLYINKYRIAAFINSLDSGSINDLYIQSGLINGTGKSSLIDSLTNSNVNNVYFDGVIASNSLTEYKLYDYIKMQSIGSSSTIDYNVSSDYAEANYNESSGYAYKPGVYQFQDDSDVYFYRGSVENNYVTFGGFCWRILRTTSTGGTKLLFYGDSCSLPNYKVVASGMYNANQAPDINGATAYMYEYNGTVYENAAKIAVDNWYANNMTSYTNYIEDTPYCNNLKSVSYDSSKIGLSNSEDIITWHEPIYYASPFTKNVRPNLSCGNAYSYTVSSSNGNGKLTYPVGMITQDESVLAGLTSGYTTSGGIKSNAKIMAPNSFIVDKDNTYFGMSPNLISTSDGAVSSAVGHNGDLISFGSAGSVKPVISIKNEVKIKTGSGMYFDPFVLDVQNQSGEQTLINHIKEAKTTDSNIVIDTEENGKQNYRYIGSNPKNYVCLGGTQSNCSDGELYRIIGIFGDDVHGQTGKELVKLIRANGFSNIKYDAKAKNVGSRGNTSNPSSDWSDSQLMYLLNGTHYLNSGYKLGGTTPVHNWTLNNNNISDGTTSFYKVQNSYYDGGGSVYIPKEVTRGTQNYTATSRNIAGLNEKARSLVQEAVWHTGSVSYNDDTSAPKNYTRELGVNTFSGKPDYWIGKIGLITLSDFLYGTSGGRWATRSTCLRYGNDDAYTEDGGCEESNWLAFNYNYIYYFITPSDSVWDTYGGKETVWGFDCDDFFEYYYYTAGVEFNNSEYEYDVLPALYVKENTIITSGSGTITSPYMLDLPVETETTYENDASIINYMVSSNVNNIKVEGAIIADALVNIPSFIAGDGASITNFEITSDIYGNVGVGLGTDNCWYWTTAPVFANGYYNGNVYTNAPVVSIIQDDAAEYNDVFIVNKNSANIEYLCSDVNECGNIKQSYDSTKSGYLAQDTMINNMNNTFNSANWKKTTGKLPDLSISSDNINPTAIIKVYEGSSTTPKVTYTGPVGLMGTYQFNGNIRVNVESVSDNTAIKEVKYLISDHFVAYPQNETYADLVGDLTITDQGIHVVYFKITDINNNVSYINTDYLVNTSFTRTRTVNRDTISTQNVKKSQRVVDTFNISKIHNNYDKLNIKTTSIPVGTVLSFTNNGKLYQYKIPSYTTYVALTNFKESGTTTYFSGTLGDELKINYDFSNTEGGTLNTSLVYKVGTTEVVTTSGNSETAVTSTNSLTLSNSIGTKSISGISSTDISYSVNSSYYNEYHYLKMYLTDNNDRKLNVPTISGLSISYNNEKYYSNEDGEIIIPIGRINTSPQSKSLILNVEYLSNTLAPGTYKLTCVLENKYASSSPSSFNVTLNYLNKDVINNYLLVTDTATSKVLDKSSNSMSLSFNIKTFLQGTDYSSASITTKVSLYKKESLSSNTYTKVDINNYLAYSSRLSGGSSSVYPIGNTLIGNTNNNYNLTFNKNSITNGAYRLDIQFNIGSYEVKTENVYFIVK